MIRKAATIRERIDKLQKSGQSLDQAIYELYRTDYPDLTLEAAKNKILALAKIDEYQYYTQRVKPALRRYITDHVFPEYAKNDQGHGLAHIKTVIQRSFALNDTFQLHLQADLIFTIAACHDLGKYLDHAQHHLIAAQQFQQDTALKKFFNPAECQIITEAIEDHRSSKADRPRSVYGQLVSSADRNTTINSVFVRSFHVALDRMPDTKIADYLDYTLDRLRKKYDTQDPENMFYEDNIYQAFLKDMRALLSQPDAFKALYCQINHITDRSITVAAAHAQQQKQTPDELNICD